MGLRQMSECPVAAPRPTANHVTASYEAPYATATPVTCVPSTQLFARGNNCTPWATPPCSSRNSPGHPQQLPAVCTYATRTVCNCSNLCWAITAAAAAALWSTRKCTLPVPRHTAAQSHAPTLGCVLLPSDALIHEQVGGATLQPCNTLG
jgi:hypothetical protein